MIQLIDKNELKEWVDGWFVMNKYYHPYSTQTNIPVSELYDIVERIPTVDAVPVRHGKWIYGNDFHWYTASCSACGYQRRTDIKATGWNQWKYCPHCGAKMGGEE